MTAFRGGIGRFLHTNERENIAISYSFELLLDVRSSKDIRLIRDPGSLLAVSKLCGLPVCSAWCSSKVGSDREAAAGQFILNASAICAFGESW